MKPDAATPRRYLETLRRLKPEQIWYQIRRRLDPPWLRRFPRIPSEGLRLSPGWGTAVRRCRPTCDPSVLQGRFRFWGKERQLELTRPWLAADLGRSWNYPVHYFDALPGLVERSESEPDLLPAILQWLDHWLQAHPPGTPVAWDPYPTAIRLVNWVDALQGLETQIPEGWRQTLLRSLFTQALWLEARLERHLLGTHLLKDVKALLVTATLFGDAAPAAWRGAAEALLRRELGAQVNADGSHFEPSVMYHCMALEDVLDLLNFQGALSPAAGRQLSDVARRMLDYAWGTRTPAGAYPLLGDAWPGGAPSPQELWEYAARLSLRQGSDAAREYGMRLFPQAGVLVWRDESFVVIADVGEIGPPHLAGHGHCDSLSFEVWSQGQAFLVDSGTFTYEPGAARHACRSTAAHNTLQIDAREQHEIWASFRVARRSTVRVLEQSARRIDVALVPWFEPRLQIQRRFEFAPGEIHVVDRVVGPGAHEITSRLHLHPHCQVESLTGSAAVLRNGSREIEVDWSGVLESQLAAVRRPRHLSPGVTQSGFAGAWGITQPNAELRLDLQGELPCRMTLSLRSRPHRGK